MKKREIEERLFGIAVAQSGYFRSFQAKTVGFSEQSQAYHVQAGNWVREGRGLYRLARFPLPPDSQYALWGVWSMNRKGIIQGIYSHETALALYNLTDLQPDKLHMTMPRGFRCHGGVPPVLLLHHATILAEEVEDRLGYRVTRPMRTIVDLVRSLAVSPEFIRQAVQQTLDLGYLTRSQYSGLLGAPRIGVRIQQIMGGKI